MMSEDRQRILSMVASGKITVPEAEQLLDALGHQARGSDDAPVSVKPARAKFLRVMVDGADGEKVNIRVPMQLLRAGMKLKGLLPEHAQQKVSGALRAKGIPIDLGNVDSDSLDELVEQLSQLTVNVDGADGETVRIFCE